MWIPSQLYTLSENVAELHFYEIMTSYNNIECFGAPPNTETGKPFLPNCVVRRVVFLSISMCVLIYICILSISLAHLTDVLYHRGIVEFVKIVVKTRKEEEKLSIQQ